MVLGSFLITVRARERSTGMTMFTRLVVCSLLFALFLSGSVASAQTLEPAF